MNNSQESTVDGATRQNLPAGRVVSLESAGGELSVVSGRVWLTVSGDPDDYVLEAGDSIRVPALRPAFVESWRRDESAQFAWRPRTIAQRLHDRTIGAAISLFTPVSQ